MSKTRLVREIRRSVARWPKGLQYEYANWKWRPAWWIARRYSCSELMIKYQDVESSRGDLLEDDDMPS